MRNRLITLFAILAMFVFVAVLAWPGYAGPMLDVTNLGSLHLSDTSGTATPVLRVNSSGTGKVVEFLDAGTPVFSINDGGGITASSILTQGATINNLIVTQPTAQTTATPAAVINSLAAGSVILDVQDGGTSQVKILNGGGVQIAAPTAVSTAVPAMIINNAGVSNIVEVRDAATPVFTVRNGGVVNGQVLSYATAGFEIVCGTTSTFTATTTITATGLTTATYVTASQITTPASTGAFITVSDPTTTTFTIKSWETDATAGTTGITAHWCAVGNQ